MSKPLAKGHVVYTPIHNQPNQGPRLPFKESSKQKIPIRYEHSYTDHLLSNTKITHTPITQNKSQSQQQNFDLMLKNTQNYKDLNLSKNMEIEALHKQIDNLRAKEEMYITKLIKLEEGLEVQNKQFLSLEALYTELFDRYKQRENQIAQLEKEYSKKELKLEDLSSISHKHENQSSLAAKKQSESKKHIETEAIKVFEQQNFNLREEITQLIRQNKRLNETNQKMLSQMNYIKSKESLENSRDNLSQKFFEELDFCQQEVAKQKDERVRLEYQNKFLQIRNEDLEKTVNELESIVSFKQNQIIKMREEKIRSRRQSSEKARNTISPPKSKPLESSRKKLPPNQSESVRLVKLVESLQSENLKLRQQNLKLKQKIKGALTSNKQNYVVSEGKQIGGVFSSKSFQEEVQKVDTVFRKLRYEDSADQRRQSRAPLKQNADQFNLRRSSLGQHMEYGSNDQYFSFSRQKEEREGEFQYEANTEPKVQGIQTSLRNSSKGKMKAESSEEILPTFPIDMEIENLIQKHSKSTKIILPPEQGEAQN